MKKIACLAVCVSLLFVEGIGWSTASAQLFPRLNRQPIRVQQPSQVQPQPAPITDAQRARNERRSQSNQAIVRAKTQRIDNEITRLRNHPWAGQYYQGSGLSGVTLTLAPDNGFTVRLTGDVGLMDQNHGTVEWDGNRLKFSLAFAVEEGNRSQVHATEYVPIRWGERVYLIPPDRIIGFCDAANSGREPRNNMVPSLFFLRRGDEKKAATGKPELPKEFMPYLRGEEPIIATVVSVRDIQEEEPVGSVPRSKATVVVDKGKVDGLLPGMVLYVMDQEVMSGTSMLPNMAINLLTLTKVDEMQSEGEFVGRPTLPPSSRSLPYAEYKAAVEALLIVEGLRAPIPEPGWQFSTQRQERIELR